MYETSYLTLNPAFKGTLPLGKSFNVYGQVGLRADYMVSHSATMEYYQFYIIQEKDDLKKMNYGMTLSSGLGKAFKKVILRIEYSALINFNKIIDVKGPRLDGLGDEGFFFKLNSFSSMYTLNVAFKL
jgi:hypothetical protein